MYTSESSVAGVASDCLSAARAAVPGAVAKERSKASGWTEPLR